MAKGIASGLPLSGIIARRDLMDAWKPGVHGGTYGGNVVSCAAALATLDVIDEEDLVQNASERGKQLLEGLRDRIGHLPTVGDVRGLGLMVAIEFVQPGVGDGREPNPQLTSQVQSKVLQDGLIVLTAGSYSNVLRMIPPLVTTQEEIALAVDILSRTVVALEPTQ
jgi:4-aminobutyrate aminotransferase